MTTFEAYLKFNGLACPQCKEKINIDYEGNTLHVPFTGFVPGNNIRPCCLNFYENLTDCLFLYRDGKITEPELAAELSKYKK